MDLLVARGYQAKVTALAKRDYENDPAIITAKILMR